MGTASSRPNQQGKEEEFSRHTKFISELKGMKLSAEEELNRLCRYLMDEHEDIHSNIGSNATYFLHKASMKVAEDRRYIAANALMENAYQYKFFKKNPQLEQLSRELGILFQLEKLKEFDYGGNSKKIDIRDLVLAIKPVKTDLSKVKISGTVKVIQNVYVVAPKTDSLVEFCKYCEDLILRVKNERRKNRQDHLLSGPLTEKRTQAADPAELEAARQQLAEAQDRSKTERAQLEAARKQLAEAQDILNAERAQLEAARKQLAEAQDRLNANSREFEAQQPQPRARTAPSAPELDYPYEEAPFVLPELPVERSPYNPAAFFPEVPTKPLVMPDVPKHAVKTEEEPPKKITKI